MSDTDAAANTNERLASGCADANERLRTGFGIVKANIETDHTPIRAEVKGTVMDLTLNHPKPFWRCGLTVSC